MISINDPCGTLNLPERLRSPGRLTRLHGCHPRIHVFLPLWGGAQIGVAVRIVVISLAQTQAVNGKGGAVSRKVRVKPASLGVYNGVFDTRMGLIELRIGAVRKHTLDALGIVHREVERWGQSCNTAVTYLRWLRRTNRRRRPCQVPGDQVPQWLYISSAALCFRTISGEIVIVKVCKPRVRATSFTASAIRISLISSQP